MRTAKSPKRPIKLSLNAQEVQRRYWEQWNEENKEAVAAYNARIEREGLPLARYRTFMKGR